MPAKNININTKCETAFKGITFDKNKEKAILALKYYYLKNLYSEEEITLCDTAHAYKKHLEQSLFKSLNISRWKIYLVQMAGYSKQFLLEQSLSKKNIIFNNYSPYDYVINQKLTSLAKEIVENGSCNSKNIFYKILSNYELEPTSEISAELVNIHKTQKHENYRLIRYRLSALINPKSVEFEKKLPADPKLDKLLRFLLDFQDSTHLEFSGFDLLSYIKSRYFQESADANPDLKNIDHFSKFLIDIFHQFEQEPTKIFDQKRKDARLKYLKTAINQCSDLYHWPYRIEKLKLTEKNVLVNSCEQMFKRLRANKLIDCSIDKPANLENLRLSQLRFLEQKLADQLDYYQQINTVNQQMVSILKHLKGLRPPYAAQTDGDYPSIYMQKFDEILLKIKKTHQFKHTKRDAKDKTQYTKDLYHQISKLHEELLFDIKGYAKHCNNSELIELANKLFFAYPYVSQNTYSYKQRFSKTLYELQAPIENQNELLKNKEKLCRLISDMCDRIRALHEQNRPKYQINTTPIGRNYRYVYKTRKHSYSSKKARRKDKEIVKTFSWPIRIPLALFQALVNFGGMFLFTANFVTPGLAFGIGSVFFVFSYISNDQLVANPLYRRMIDIFVDNQISHAESTTSKLIINFVAFLCLGTGLTMSLVALGFSLNLFANPGMLLLIFLAGLDVLPTTLGFGALMLKTFESVLFSIGEIFSDFFALIKSYVNAITLTNFIPKFWQIVVSPIVDNIAFKLNNQIRMLKRSSLEDNLVALMTTLLTPFIFVTTTIFTVLTTVGMIGAWYKKVAEFLTHFLKLTPWVAELVSLNLTATAVPPRSVFNFKNMTWGGFFIAEVACRYLVVKPILAPFKIASFVYHNYGILLDSIWHKMTYQWQALKKDPYLSLYHLSYRLKRSISLKSHHALIVSAVGINCMATGTAAAGGGEAIQSMTGLNLNYATLLSIAVNTSLSGTTNYGAVQNIIDTTPAASNDMPLEKAISQADRSIVGSSQIANSESENLVAKFSMLAPYQPNFKLVSEADKACAKKELYTGCHEEFEYELTRPIH